MKTIINSTALLGFILVAVFAINLVGPTMAEETTTTNFCVNNGIFTVGREKPVMRSTTIFLDGIVYDFMFETATITIFDEVKGVFTLINVKRHTQTVITMEFVDKAIERLVTRAASKKDPETQFLYNPKYEPLQKDTKTGELLFQSPWITYRVDAKQGDVKATKQYRRFADAYAKLNTVLQPRNKPPFARMLVNKTLGESTMLPHSVAVAYGKKGDFFWAQFSSKHRYEMKISNYDKKRIEKLKKSLDTLKVVTLNKYQKL